MYYIYKIENIKNHKKYIGLTNNIKRRRSRHFTDLKCNRHENSFLQKEYNIFGKENFTFEQIFEGDISINEITNERIELVQKHSERLKNAKLKFLKENGENREYLTKQELEEIRDNIQRFLPGITLSIASIEELGDIEPKHYFENTKSQTNLNGINSQSFLGSGKGKDNATINPKETVYLDNGAGTNVIAIHQRDGSAMLATVVETAKKIENHLQRIFLGVHDAVVTDANSSLEIQNKINKISYEMDINNNQLAQFEDIARKNIIIAED